MENKISEEFLHFVWKSRLYGIPLKDTSDQELEVVDPGQHNHDAGPDFFNARIRMGGILWAGNVELHLKSSDWYLHGHHHDPAYNNVILHVVLNPDCMVNNAHMDPVPTAQLHLREGILNRYSALIGQKETVPCSRIPKHVDSGQVKAWLETLLFDRLRQKRRGILRNFKETGGNREEELYRLFARAFGQHVNAFPFEMLSRSMPLSILKQYSKQLIHLEALFFGQSGQLSFEVNDAYSRELKSLYRGHRTLYRLQPMDRHLWKFLRLRPMNFPGIRISQLALALHTEPELFRELIHVDQVLEYLSKLDIRASPYWETHYIMGKESRKCRKSPGKKFLQHLLLNAVIPVRFAIAIPGQQDRGLTGWADALHSMPPEDNRIVRMWKSRGIAVPDAFYSQALLQLGKKVQPIT